MVERTSPGGVLAGGRDAVINVRILLFSLTLNLCISPRVSRTIPFSTRYFIQNYANPAHTDPDQGNCLGQFAVGIYVQFHERINE